MIIIIGKDSKMLLMNFLKEPSMRIEFNDFKLKGVTSDIYLRILNYDSNFIVFNIYKE